MSKPKLTVAQNSAWMEQAKGEAIGWHIAKGISDKALDGFAAGYEAGWRDAIKTLKLHKLIAYD